MLWYTLAQNKVNRRAPSDQSLLLITVLSCAHAWNENNEIFELFVLANGNTTVVMRK